MYVNLDAPQFVCDEGFATMAAALDEPGVLHVEIFGTEDCVREITSIVLAGPVDAELLGEPIRFRRFLILNQGDPRRLVMDCRYEVVRQHREDWGTAPGRRYV